MGRYLVSYFGNRYLDHFERDLEEIADHGFNGIVHCATEADVEWGLDRLGEIFAATTGAEGFEHVVAECAEAARRNGVSDLALCGYRAAEVTSLIRPTDPNKVWKMPAGRFVPVEGPVQGPLGSPRAQRRGLMYSYYLVIIIHLMVWKPGG